jgi:phosphoribosylformylglycinamidine cyclo-ligase
VGYFAAVLDLGGGRGLAVSCDGVGTKILLAIEAGRYDTVGIDCIAMNVNDLLCVGAEPIAMLDYLAVGDPEPEMMEALGRGLAEGARQARISIPGGEMAQVPELLAPTSVGVPFDLVGTAIGVIDLSEVNVGREVEPGDVVVGVASSGVHSNGFTLIRKVFPEMDPALREELLRPTAIYVDLVEKVRQAGVGPHAMIHVTGEGLLNLLRVAPEVTFRIDQHPDPPEIFGRIQAAGRVDDAEMFRTFNMGVGFVLVVEPGREEATRRAAIEAGHEAWVLGRVEEGRREVRLERWGLIGSEGRFRSQ